MCHRRHRIAEAHRHQDELRLCRIGDHPRIVGIVQGKAYRLVFAVFEDVEKIKWVEGDLQVCTGKIYRHADAALSNLAADGRQMELAGLKCEAHRAACF